MKRRLLSQARACPPPIASVPTETTAALAAMQAAVAALAEAAGTPQAAVAVALPAGTAAAREATKQAQLQFQQW